MDRYAWPYMAMHGHARPCMAMDVHPLPLMTMHGHSWPCMAVHGHGWPCMAMYGHVWPSMAMHGHPWLYMAMSIKMAISTKMATSRKVAMPYIMAISTKSHQNRCRFIRSIRDSLPYPPLPSISPEAHQNGVFLASSRLGGNREAKSINRTSPD